VIHHTLQRAQSCGLQALFQRGGSGYASAKRAVEMKVCSMDESQRVHVGVCMTYSGQIRSPTMQLKVEFDSGPEGRQRRPEAARAG